MDHRKLSPELPGMSGATLEEFKALLQAAGMTDLAEKVGVLRVASIVAVAIRRPTWGAALAEWFDRWGKEQMSW